MKYKLFIRKYSIFTNDYITEERIVETNDIYHEIGKIYCTTLEDIKRISYFKVDEKKELQQRIDKKKELQQRIDKAIEYIESYNLPDNLGILGEAPITLREVKEILEILKGEE